MKNGIKATLGMAFLAAGFALAGGSAEAQILIPADRLLNTAIIPDLQGNLPLLREAREQKNGPPQYHIDSVFNGPVIQGGAGSVFTGETTAVGQQTFIGDGSCVGTAACTVEGTFTNSDVTAQTNHGTGSGGVTGNTLTGPN